MRIQQIEHATISAEKSDNIDITPFLSRPYGVEIAQTVIDIIPVNIPNEILIVVVIDKAAECPRCLIEMEVACCRYDVDREAIYTNHRGGHIPVKLRPSAV